MEKKNQPHNTSFYPLQGHEEKEKIQLIKLQTSTLSDLLNMVKEAQEIKKIREFEDLMFSILTDEQKEQVKRLFS